MFKTVLPLMMSVLLFVAGCGKETQKTMQDESAMKNRPLADVLGADACQRTVLSNRGGLSQ